MNKYKWKLNVSNFTWLDRLKICAFFLNIKNFWTMNKYVQKFEKEMASFMGFKYALFVSSGSTANTILAMYLRDKLKKESSTRNIVVLPSTTWQTSCSPWIREGFDPYFIDISMDNFSIDSSKLIDFVSKNHEKIAAIFPTSLLGFNTNCYLLKQLKENYPQIEFFIDQCENNFGPFESASLNVEHLQEFTSTTSTYMGHEIQSVEGGFIFTNNLYEYQQFLMYRNHGMVRSLSECGDWKIAYENKKVDSRFDFYCLGNNFRNSDIHAFLGLLDFRKRFKYIKKRRKLYGIFQSNLNKSRYLLPQDSAYRNSWYVPFCIPIICKGEQRQERLLKIKEYCKNNSIETRPIISGFLGYQTAYQGMMDEKNYPNSIYLHNNGIYLGLHTKLKKSQIIKLTKFLNEI